MSLSPLDHIHDARQSAVARQLADPHFQRAFPVYRASVNSFAGTLVHRERLTGYWRLIDSRFAGQYFSIHRNSHPRPHEHDLLKLNFLDREIEFCPVAPDYSGLGRQVR